MNADNLFRLFPRTLLLTLFLNDNLILKSYTIFFVFVVMHFFFFLLIEFTEL